MGNEIKDPGFGTGFKYKTKRIVNPDGSFNIIRKGAFIKWKDAYKYLLDKSWGNFFGVLFLFYILLNLLFTILYWMCGFDNISGINPDNGPEFMQAFYFSVQTFTTVGYGVMAPSGMATQIVSSIEAFVGFLSFSLATGLLYGRFSKPNAKILFSQSALITPYKGGINSLQVKIVNARDNVLLDIEAKIILVFDESKKAGGVMKKYFQLPLEIKKLSLLPLSWTIVHPIDSESPIFDMSKEELQDMNPEIIVLIQGFDEVFSQNVNTKKSYIADEWLWNKKFTKIFSSSSDGNIVLDLAKIDDLEDVEHISKHKN